MGSGKGKAPTTGCYRCGQPGHIARDCKVSIHNLQEVDNNDYQQDTTSQWYNQTTYDNHWWTSGQTQVNAVQPQQQLALPAHSQLDAQPALQIAAVTAQRNNDSTVRAQDKNMNTNLNKDELMIDSGAATRVCPVWFASTTPTYGLPEQDAPNLRTATEEPIKV